MMVTLLQQYTSAVFHETLRCFPPVPQLAKPVKSDAVLQIKRFTHQPAGSNKLGDLEEVEMKVPAQSIVVVDILGTHMSRKTDFLPMYNSLAHFGSQRCTGEKMLKISNQNGSSTLTPTAGLETHVRLTLSC